MTVQAIDTTSVVSTATKPGASARASAETSDVSWFNAQMREKAPAPDSENNVAARIIDSLSSRSGGWRWPGAKRSRPEPSGGSCPHVRRRLPARGARIEVRRARAGERIVALALER